MARLSCHHGPYSGALSTKTGVRSHLELTHPWSSKKCNIHEPMFQLRTRFQVHQQHRGNPLSEVSGHMVGLSLQLPLLCNKAKGNKYSNLRHTSKILTLIFV
ncbi:hypothetical protein CsSME_00033426 [Camellia sinensis var. sinensis]